MNTERLYDSVSIKKLLTNAGINKAYIIDENLYCTLFLGIYNDQQYIILIAKGTHSFYSKIVPASTVLETYWRCNYITYVPEGLYVFAKSVEELINKIMKIIEKYQKYTTRYK